MILAACIVLLLVDCLQTRVIFQNPHKWRETNPVIRWLHARIPRGIEAYFAFWIGACVAAWQWMPHAELAVGVVLAVQVLAVTNNFMRGIKP